MERKNKETLELNISKHELFAITIIGVLSAILLDVPFGFPDMVEHIVLAGNIKMLDQQKLKAALENGQ